MKDELGVPAERELPADRMAARREHLMREITTTVKPSRRRRWLTVTVPATVLVLGIAGVAAAYLIPTPGPQAVAASVACYQKADLQANAAYKGSTGESPLDICARLWSSGVIDSSQTTVPSLVACPLGSEDQGVVGVFPSGDPLTCGRLGLAQLPSGYENAAAKFAGLRDALNERIGRTCVALDDAKGIVEDELDSSGFSDWNVVTSSDQANPGENCTSLGFDLQHRSVLLISNPDPSGGSDTSQSSPSPAP